MLILPAPLLERLRAEARAAFPAECCGLLEGVREEGGAVRVLAVHCAANLAFDPTQGFEIDPAAHFRLLRGLRGSGREVVGCYHSHPNGRNTPSERDRQSGNQPGCADGFVWVIIATGVIEEIVAFEGPGFVPLAVQG